MGRSNKRHRTGDVVACCIPLLRRFLLAILFLLNLNLLSSNKADVESLSGLDVASLWAGSHDRTAHRAAKPTPGIYVPRTKVTHTAASAASSTSHTGHDSVYSGFTCTSKLRETAPRSTEIQTSILGFAWPRLNPAVSGLD